jgi:hypothetical protein
MPDSPQEFYSLNNTAAQMIDTVPFVRTTPATKVFLISFLLTSIP